MQTSINIFQILKHTVNGQRGTRLRMVITDILVRITYKGLGKLETPEFVTQFLESFERP